ncbi:MFS transporter [Winogradskyella alexanderae]|uniref:MFS transporter n=1 Tax=Winogradskyella alexanderae TaxID=2877123 RepID=A0ABS7XR79_9FLAO|nr:MFS transporter [Winogradskyella alexanderae]MCA0132505.1 MFS transporter [Winogradskyella alexanderae]
MYSLRLILSNWRYFSVVWVFSSLNIMIGTWVLYIPRIKEKLRLSDSEIGFALFCLALGLMFFIPLVPLVTRKFGLGRCTIVGVCLFCIAFLGPLIAPSYTVLCIALFVVGNFSGLTDIAMNTLVSEMEKTDSVNIMSAAHGFFSLGGAIGALVGTVLLTIFEAPFYHMLLMAVMVIVTNLVLSGLYVNIRETEEKKKEKDKLPLKVFRPLFILAFLALVTMGNEGAIEHWSSIYLLEVVEVASENYAGFGFTVFSIMMTIGRFFGDGISTKIGSAKIVFLGCLLAAIGYLAVLSKGLVLSLIGFGIIGLGLSVIIPELIRMAGKTGGVAASKSISFVTGIGFLGFLLGPIVIGYISENFTLQMSFVFLMSVTAIALLISMFKLRTK